MKKLISVLLVLVMVLAMVVGCSKKPGNETPDVVVPASALEILENIWAQYGVEEKFFAMGGDFSNPVDGAPGNFSLENPEDAAAMLHLPADQAANVDQAASLIHAMNTNTFTCGVFKIENISAADFGAAMKDAVLNNQWMCGFPETLLIRNFGDSYVLVAFGVNDAMTPFETHLTEAYPGMETIASEPIV